MEPVLSEAVKLPWEEVETKHAQDIHTEGILAFQGKHHKEACLVVDDKVPSSLIHSASALRRSFAGAVGVEVDPLVLLESSRRSPRRALVRRGSAGEKRARMGLPPADNQTDHVAGAYGPALGVEVRMDLDIVLRQRSYSEDIHYGHHGSAPVHVCSQTEEGVRREGGHSSGSRLQTPRCWRIRPRERDATSCGAVCEQTRAGRAVCDEWSVYEEVVLLFLRARVFARMNAVRRNASKVRVGLRRCVDEKRRWGVAIEKPNRTVQCRLPQSRQSRTSFPRWRGCDWRCASGVRCRWKRCVRCGQGRPRRARSRSER